MSSAAETGGPNASGPEGIGPKGTGAARIEADPTDADRIEADRVDAGQVDAGQVDAAGITGDAISGGAVSRYANGAGRVDAAVLRARAYLLRVAEPPAPATAGFVARAGPVAAAEAIRRGDVPEEVARETGARRSVDLAEADLAAARAVGARLLVPEAADWPHWPFLPFGGPNAWKEGRVPGPRGVADHRELAPPLALWVRGSGDLAALTERAVAVVGSRGPSGYGAHVAADLGAGLVQRGHTVVSGAALGIDGEAHRGALAARGPTVAVLACGPDRAYPASHEALLERIAARGLVVSEYPPGAVPARHRFLVRNRLIAALAAGTVVVEAGSRSGAQRTAAVAEALGKVVMAIPGPVTSAMSVGCHELIRRGALLVTRAEEVLEATGRIGVDLACERERPARPTDLLDAVQARVHDALPARAARDAGWLAVEAGLTSDAVRVALVELERLGLAESREGRWQRPVARRGGA